MRYRLRGILLPALLKLNKQMLKLISSAPADGEDISVRRQGEEVFLTFWKDFGTHWQKHTFDLSVSEAEELGRRLSNSVSEPIMEATADERLLTLTD